MTPPYAYATIDADGFPTGFWQTAAYPEPEEGEDRPSVVPAEAIPLTEVQLRNFLDHLGLRRLVDGEVVVYDPPPFPLPPIFLPADVLYAQRMTDDEFDALEDSVRRVDGSRVYRGFVAVHAFTEGTDMWALLVKHLDLIGVTSERKAELLEAPKSAFAATGDTMSGDLAISEA